MCITSEYEIALARENYTVDFAAFFHELISEIVAAGVQRLSRDYHVSLDKLDAGLWTTNLLPFVQDLRAFANIFLFGNQVLFFEAKQLSQLRFQAFGRRSIRF